MEPYLRRCSRERIIFCAMLSVLVPILALERLDQAQAMSQQQQANENKPNAKQPNHKSSLSSTRARSTPQSNNRRSSSSTSLVRLNRQNSSSATQVTPDQQDIPMMKLMHESLAQYRNEPPNFIAPKRDFVVDVAKFVAGKRITTIQAYDGDGDPLEFYLGRAPIGDASQYFSINRTSGELTLSGKLFRYRLAPPLSDKQRSNSTSTDNGGITGDEDGGEEEEEEMSEDERAMQLVNATGSGVAAEPFLNLYFLNVAVSDGQSTHNSTLELHIHVTNSTLMRERGPVDSVDDLSSESEETLRRLIKQKTEEFYAKLNQMSPNQVAQLPQQVGATTGNLSATLVDPVYLNPGLNVDSPRSALHPQLTGANAAIPESASYLSPFSDELPMEQQQEQQRGSTSRSGTSGGTLQNPTTWAPATSAAPFASHRQQSIGSLQEQQTLSMVGHHSPNGMTSTITTTIASTDMATTNLLIIMCSCLMIALVLLMFIVPLSVKRLRKRLKHVELQHGHLSQKNSNVSSMTIDNPSLATNSARNHHHQHLNPSLSHLTSLASDGSATSCLRGDSSVFRQSSLDSAMTSSTMSQRHQHHQHQFNRVDNGSIANPVYLDQHHQHQRPQRPQPFVFGDLKQQAGDGQNIFGLQAPVNAAHENVYYPLSDDEFYSTIQTETTPLGEDNLLGSAGGHQLGLQQALVSPAGGWGQYQMAQYNQPDVESRPLESPDSSPAVRALTRFLSLPARHQLSSVEPTTGQEEVDTSSSSHVKQLEMHVGSRAFAATLHRSQPQQQQQQQQFSKTIARTCNVDREQAGWELERHRLRHPWLMLDEGQFGQVWRCKLSPGHKQPERLVAVKSLKKDAASCERQELMAEIEIMQLVCDHPNVVRLLHCCTLDANKPIYLVMEYVEQGKLQSYLAKSRKNHLYGTIAADAPLPLPVQPPHYQLQPPSSSSDYLTSRDLMKFIYHVAKGMEYISSKCIVHRDLASRNILVSGQKICKIGDFGMARHMQSFADVYERHSGNSKIPVRWMAPEVLLSNSFTTRSDVFSFGILMWEIITLGSTPYTHLKTDQVIDRVAKNGERPERPEYCHPQLYSIMSQCWQSEPTLRPSFKKLVDILGELVLSANNYIELDQYPDHDYYNIPKTAAPGELL